MRIWIRGLGALAVIAAGSGNAGGEQSPGHSTGRDSMAVLDAARSSQAGFERARRFHLAPNRNGATGRECDERIGRFCYWYDEADTLAPAEPETIKRARHKLLTELGRDERASPGDDWIMGQLIRYLVENGQPDSAVASALRCRGSGWWCAALTGFAWHAAGRFAEAEDAFLTGLRSMPGAERCLWNDLSLLLDGEMERTYRTLACPEREAWNERLWLLARPLLASAGNDFRTELWARRVMIRLLQNAHTAYGFSMGEDHRELVLRYGWPTGWSRSNAFDDVINADHFSVTGYDPSPSYAFLPLVTWQDDVDPRSAGGWDLRARRPRVRYAPAYAKSFQELDQVQIARFRRGDSSVVVAAWATDDDTVFRSGSKQAALVLARDPMTPTITARREMSGASGVLIARAPWPADVVGLELEHLSSKRFARTRVGDFAPDDPSSPLSDLLFLHVTDSAQSILEEAATHAVAGDRVPEAARIALFWEMYAPLSRVDSLQVVLSIYNARREPKGPITSPARWTKGPAILSLSWVDRPESVTPVASRWITLDLAKLSRGHYVLVLEAKQAQRGLARAARGFEVVVANHGVPE